MFLAICVSMIPGSTMANRMLNALTSWARHSLSASSANLDAVYAALLPEVGEIGAERSEPLGRKLEVERLRKRDRGRRR